MTNNVHTWITTIDTLSRTFDPTKEDGIGRTCSCTLLQIVMKTTLQSTIIHFLDNRILCKLSVSMLIKLFVGVARLSFWKVNACYFYLPRKNPQDKRK